VRLPQLRICWLRPSCSLCVLLFVSPLLAADHASGKKTAGQLQGAFIGNLYRSTGEDLRVLLSVAVLWVPRRGCSTESVGMARVGISRTDNLVDSVRGKVSGICTSRRPVLGDRYECATGEDAPSRETSCARRPLWARRGIPQAAASDALVGLAMKSSA